jgi:SH3 domain protein
MRRTAILTIALLLLGVVTAHASTVYVSDSLEITMRSGPSNQHRILRMLTSDTKLEALKEDDGWLQVRAADGREGWVLKRYTTQNLPRSIQIQRLQQQNERLTALSGGAATQLTALEEENASLKAALEKTQGELSRLSTQHVALKKDAADVVTLKDEFTATRQQLDAATLSMGQLKAENMDLRSSTNLRWFLTGAGVVSTAWLFGFIMGRIQRRKRPGISF